MHSNLTKIKKYVYDLDCMEDVVKNAPKEAEILREDIEFLSLYMKRNKETDFQLNIVPQKGLCRKFLRDIFINNYCYCMKYLDEMIIEYHFLKITMEIAQRNVLMRSEKERIADTYTYFKETYNMDIRDYVGDFINCSLGCRMALENISAIAETLELEQDIEKE